MLKYANLIALVKNSLESEGAAVNTITGFVNGDTRGDSDDYPVGISVLYTGDDPILWNGNTNIVLTEKIDGNHLLQFETDVATNEIYYRTWAEPVEYSDPIDPNTTLDSTKWSPQLTADSNGRVKPSSGLNYLVPLVDNFTFTVDYAISNFNTNTAYVQVYITIGGIEYRFGQYRGTVWLTRVYENDTIVYSNSNPYSKCKFERSGTTLNVSVIDGANNEYLLYSFTGVSTEDSSAVFMNSGDGAGDAWLEGVEGQAFSSQGTEVYGIGGWSNWKIINDSNSIEFNPYGNLTENVVQDALNQFIDTYLTQTDANNTYKTISYVDDLFNNYDWQNSVHAIWRNDISMPGSFSDGDRYIAYATGSGWIEDYIYEWQDGQWIETIPNEGFAVTVESRDRAYHYIDGDWVILRAGGNITWNVMSQTTTNKQLKSGYGYLIDNESGLQYAVDLPASPQINDEVAFLYNGGDFSSANVTINRNGSNIMSLAENMSININDFSFSLTYIDAAIGWRIRE